jgi:3-oxoacyl-[acyl-carrier-protein] synthase II
MSIYTGLVPPTANLQEPDPECGLSVVTSLKEKEIHLALSTSFGFGGVNAAVILQKIA